MTAISIATFLWLLYSAAKSASLLCKQQVSISHIATIVHFVVNGTPLILDIIWGSAEWYRYPMIHTALHNNDVHILYCGLISVCPIIWWSLAPRSIQSRHILLDQMTVGLPDGATAILKALLFLPIVLIPFAPNPEVYLNYTPYYRGFYESSDIANFHVFISWATVVSTLCSIALLAHSRDFNRTLLLLIPFFLLSFWLSGKRNIVAIGTLGVILCMWRKLDLGVYHKLLLSIIVSVALLLYCDIYQKHLRFPREFAESRSSALIYENYRADFSRDHSIKLPLYLLLYPNKGQVLDYPGQSFEIWATAVVPRRTWPEKPPSYAYRLSSTAEGGDLKATGGSLTSSWIGEAIDNFGILGLILGPVSLGILFRIGDASTSNLYFGLTAVVSIMLTVVHLPAFFPLAALWLAWTVRNTILSMVSRGQ